MGVFNQVYRDYRRYRAEGSGSWWTAVYFNHGLWATTYYRIARHIQTNMKPRILAKILMPILGLFRPFIESFTGVSLGPNTQVGEGLCIYHYGPTCIGGAAKIGDNCSLRQGVSVGVAGTGEDKGAPTLGDRVDIGPFAVVVGKITVGDDVFIAANSFLTRSVPSHSFVAGNPARVLSNKGSFDTIRYDGMENDPRRILSLEARDAAELVKGG